VKKWNNGRKHRQNLSPWKRQHIFWGRWGLGAGEGKVRKIRKQASLFAKNQEREYYREKEDQDERRMRESYRLKRKENHN